MRLSRIEKMRLESQPVLTAQQLSSLEELAAQMMGGPLHKTQSEYIFYDDKVSWLTGPIGTGKTAAAVARMTIPALCLPGSSWFVGRAVKWTLEETTLKEYLSIWSRLGPGLIVDKQESPIIKYWLAPAVPSPDDGKAEPVEFIFHSIDDLEKLGGTAFTGVEVDEANEITQQQAATLDARLRKRLRWQKQPVGPFYLNFVSNPVRRSHWLHKMFCGEEDCDPVPWGRKFLADKKENEANLPPGYYEDRAKGMTPEMKLRFIEGQCGPDPAGEGVFVQEWDNNLHVRDGLAKNYTRGLGGIRGWDFGRRRPACVIAQKQRNGQVWRLAAQMGNNESLENFGRKILARCGEQFPGITSWTDFCDPHGDAKRDVSEQTSLDVLRSLGVNPRSRHHSIATRLELMSKGLTTLVDKKPRSLYDRTNCGLLIEGYGGGYCWPPASPTTGAIKDKPLADGWYEHPMDADGYIEVGLAGPLVDTSKFPTKLHKVRNPYTGR
jgi:hypothetical protein